MADRSGSTARASTISLRADALADFAHRPTLRFMLSHPAHMLSLGFGAGLSPAAPGTVGTLLAFPLYWALTQRLSPVGVLALIPILFVLGVWAAARTGRDLGVLDHGGIVWDEIVAFLLVLVFTPEGWEWGVTAFVVFRFFDIVKPPPIRHFDRTVKGGFGVMLDDLLAALYTLMVLALASRVAG